MSVRFVGLVIDDDPNILEMCQQRFQSYKFVGAANHTAAISAIESRDTYHFILLDYKLGNYNGFDLIKRIRKYRIIIPIIVLSAHSNKEVLVEAILKKPDAFIEKPINFQLLERTIGDLIVKVYPEKHADFKIVTAIQSIIADLKDYDRGIFDKGLSDYAEEHGVSYKALSYQFKIQMGQSFRRYVIDKKMGIAKQLLYASDLSIMDIASRLGYWNPSSFMKIFKKESGKTPDEYRTSL